MGKFDNIAILTDLDKTFLADGSKMVDRNVEAIEYFKSEGGIFTFVTGRMPYYSKDAFEKASTLINSYYKELDKFSHKYSITSQSKFASTFLEEISTYLFKNIPEIKSGEFGVFNKKVY